MPDINSVNRMEGVEIARAAAASKPTESVFTKDADGKATDAKFGDIWNNIQSKYGAKAEKPREIKKTLGKDDFLRIMITQMKNQDPTEPFKADQMAAQMAQYASVEQLQNINGALGKLAGQNQPMERLAMTSMIGKTVTIDRDRFPHTEGQSESLSFNLPKDASSVKVQVVAESGETVSEKDLGAMKAGQGSYLWDGTKLNTLPAKTGGYQLRVVALDEKQQTIQTSSQGQARVIGVSFEGSEAVFLVGDPSHPDKVTMKNVIKISDSGPAIPGVQSLAADVGAPSAPAGIQPVPNAAPEGAKNFFTFKKGEGSQNLDASDIPPELLSKVSQQLTDSVKTVADANPAIKAEGFPSGLSDPEQQGAASLQKGGNAQP